MIDTELAKADMNSMSKASEMKVGDMKETLSGFQILNTRRN